MTSKEGKSTLHPSGDLPDDKKQAPDPSKAASTSEDKKKKDEKKKEKQLRPSTPPAQTGSRLHDEDGNSPLSQACESGTVTPNSEGIWRKDRKRFHQPPDGFGP